MNQRHVKSGGSNSAAKTEAFRTISPRQMKSALLHKHVLQGSSFFLFMSFLGGGGKRLQTFCPNEKVAHVAQPRSCLLALAPLDCVTCHRAPRLTTHGDVFPKCHIDKLGFANAFQLLFFLFRLPSPGAPFDANQSRHAG